MDADRLPLKRWLQFQYMNDLVSVCIPVYNGEHYLGDCLAAVAAQTHTNLDILVVDDGSKDGSVELVKQFAQRDKRVRLIVNEQNLGLVGNWIKCIEEAKGSWVKFMFQDDTMVPGCVEKMLSSCIQHLVNMAICSREFIIEENTSDYLKEFFTKHVIKLEDTFPKEIKLKPSRIAEFGSDKLFKNFIGEPIVLLFNKQVVKAVGTYNRELSQMVDYEFALRACLHDDVVFIPEKLVTFRTHSDSASNANSVTTTDIKVIKSQYVEPLVMYHEYLFNPHFKLLRKKFGVKSLFHKAVIFYHLNARNYQVPGELLKHLLSKYKGIYLLKFASKLLSLKNSKPA